jgi:hypothetical protein
MFVIVLACSWELFHLWTGAAPFDSGQESRVLSSEVKTDGCVTLLALLQFDVGVSSSMAVFFTNFLFWDFLAGQWHGCSSCSSFSLLFLDVFVACKLFLQLSVTLWPLRALLIQSRTHVCLLSKKNPLLRNVSHVREVLLTIFLFLFCNLCQLYFLGRLHFAFCVVLSL